ncbi:MAG: hypothetical protein J6X67_05515, partial [Treponema sp.]|nr:hypothetical protein [Treponema sp.]
MQSGIGTGEKRTGVGSIIRIFSITKACGNKELVVINCNFSFKLFFVNIDCVYNFALYELVKAVED